MQEKKNNKQNQTNEAMAEAQPVGDGMSWVGQKKECHCTNEKGHAHNAPLNAPDEAGGGEKTRERVPVGRP